ncbi:hypothetical protein [Caldimonas thermodepolymerans]|uniref:hypothetical protein n=1 Tax=Caldimonas thermodepolymerans TaxID=215580 RepID=UPI001E33AEF2|nr:hypothetical protein [Caldimonas thermodepolymerans]
MQGVVFQAMQHRDRGTGVAGQRGAGGLAELGEALFAGQALRDRGLALLQPQLQLFVGAAAQHAVHQDRRAPDRHQSHRAVDDHLHQAAAGRREEQADDDQHGGDRSDHQRHHEARLQHGQRHRQQVEHPFGDAQPGDQVHGEDGCRDQADEEVDGQGGGRMGGHAVGRVRRGPPDGRRACRPILSA